MYGNYNHNKWRLWGQEGSCEVCGQVGRLYVDHDHNTGMIRGLLCGACNVGLGCFRDDPRRVRKALEYLERTGSTERLWPSPQASRETSRKFVEVLKKLPWAPKG